MMAKSYHDNKKGEEELETKVSNVCPWEVVAGEVKYHFEASLMTWLLIIRYQKQDRGFVYCNNFDAPPPKKKKQGKGKQR